MNENEQSKNRFESEMTRKMDVVIQKLNSYESRFDNLEQNLSEVKLDLVEVKSDLLEVKSDVKVLKGQFNDVAVMAIEDNKRITNLEGDVEELQSNIH